MDKKNLWCASPIWNILMGIFGGVVGWFVHNEHAGTDFVENLQVILFKKYMEKDDLKIE